jgi:protein-S-isoprenylcysteine O-methyltransferase Ste14
MRGRCRSDSERPHGCILCGCPLRRRKGADVKERDGEHPYGDAGQIVFLVIFLLVWIGDSFFMRETTFLSGRISLYFRLIAAAVSMFLAVLLSASGHRVVHHGEHPGHIVASGAFRYVRHPLYLASIIFYFGLTISTASLACALLWIVIIVFYDYIATYEEELLVRRFGEEYTAYKAATGRWLPRPRRRVRNDGEG